VSREDTRPARRSLVGCIAGSLIAAPFVSFAQQRKEVARIGVLGNTSGAPAYAAFVRALSELGYIEGRNIAFEWRWAQGRADRFPDLANELVRSKVDLVVTTSTQSSLAAKQATGSIPIVMAISAYPERVGLAQPGGNITGMSNVAPELSAKRIQLLKEIAPRTSRVLLMLNAGNMVETYGLQETQATAVAMGLELVLADVRTPEDYPAAFALATARRVDALRAHGNPINFQHAKPIADFALQRQIPSSYEEKAFVEVGGLLSYAPSFTDLFVRAATFVDKILRGAKPGELPIQQPTTFELAINARTAKALGLTIPQPLLLRADKLIE
jgi:putative ABC transport system substrate-binding protein